MKPVSTIKRMLRQFAMNDQPGERAANQLMDWVKGRFWLYDQLGTVRPEMIYAVIRYCSDKLKIKHIVVDSLMKCVRGEDDYNGQKDFVDTLTGLARDHDLHIHLVHHVRKGESEDKVPGKFDGKGSGAISDQVDQVLTVWRNKKKERTVEKLRRNNLLIDEDTQQQPDAMLICDKNRHGEWEGTTTLWYHPQSLQYTGDKRCIPMGFNNAMTDLVRCIACRHFSYQGANPGMATDGSFGKCDFAPSYQSVSAVFARICLKFEEADPQIVAKRLEWRDAQKAKFIKGVLG